MAVSYGEPSNRKFHFERPHLDFEVSVEEITYWQAEDGRTMKHWVYIGRKRPGADEKCKVHWNETVSQIEKEEAER